MVSTRAQTSARNNISLFQELPGEARNSVYRSLLDDITAPSTAFDMWEEDVPKYDGIATYSALIRTCRSISREVRTIFEKEYLPKIPFYFNDLGALYDFARKDAVTKLKTAGAKYVLRAPIGRGFSCGIRATHAILGQRHHVTFAAVTPGGWRIIEEVLDRGLDDGEHETFRWEGCASIDVKASGETVYCAVQLPIDGASPTHPTLTYFSRFEIGKDGETTAIIEGKLCGLDKLDDWSEEDEERLASSIKEWKAAVKQKSREHTQFDSLELATRERMMFEQIFMQIQANEAE